MFIRKVVRYQRGNQTPKIKGHNTMAKRKTMIYNTLNTEIKKKN